MEKDAPGGPSADLTRLSTPRWPDVENLVTDPEESVDVRALGMAVGGDPVMSENLIYAHPVGNKCVDAGRHWRWARPPNSVIRI